MGYDPHNPLGMDFTPGEHSYASDINPLSSGGSSQSSLLSGSMFLGMFSTIGKTISDTIALQSQAKYKAQQARFNAQMSHLQATNALQAGDQEANKIRQSANNAKSSAKVSAAASGVVVNAGSQADVSNSIDTVSGVDVLTAKNNAARRAYGYEVQANSDTAEAQVAESTGKSEVVSTILGGATQAAGQGMSGLYYKNGGYIPSTGRGA